MWVYGHLEAESDLEGTFEESFTEELPDLSEEDVEFTQYLPETDAAEDGASRDPLQGILLPGEEEGKREKEDKEGKEEKEPGFLDDEDDGDFLDADSVGEEEDHAAAPEKEEQERKPAEAGFLDDEDDFLDEEPFPEDAPFRTAEKTPAEDDPVLPDGIVITEAGEEAEKKEAGEEEEKKEEEKEAAEAAEPVPRGRKIMAIAGLAAAAGLALYAGNTASLQKSRQASLLAYASIGEDLAGRKAPGLTAAQNIAAEEKAQSEREEAAAEEASEKKALEESAGTVPVSLSISSILKDLKIKIRDDTTGALITGVPFQASVTFPDGTTAVWHDDDEDGIIYRQDLAGGTYKITLSPLYSDDGTTALADNTDYQNYGKYALPESPQTADVAEEIAYEQVDVSDEIKSASEVNVAREDTARNNTKVESTVKDTVEWTESTQTEVAVTEDTAAEEAADAASSEEAAKAAADKDLADNYEKVAKSDVPDPFATARAEIPDLLTGSFAPAQSADIQVTDPSVQSSASPTVRYVLFDTNSISASVGDADMKIGVTVRWSDGTENQDCTWSSSDTGVATVSGGTVHFVGAGTCKITATAGSHSEVCTVNVKEKSETAGITVQISGDTSVSVNGTLPLSASVSPSSDASYTWKSNNTSIASVDGNGLVTGIAPGKTQILCTAKTGSGEATGSISIEVKLDADKPVSIALTPASLSLRTGKSAKITAKAENASDSGVSFASSDTSIATVDGNGTVTAKAEGSCTITVTATADSSVTAEVSVTVSGSVTDSSPLLDADGNQLYVRDGNTIREATAADYAAYTVFYRKKAAAAAAAAAAASSEKTAVRYTGWQTIGGLTYYYDKDGNKVTGDQVIGGTSYHFSSDGVLDASNTNLCIDVSTWNGTINWSQAKSSGVSYAIIRCGYRGSSKGALVEDPSFRTNMAGAQAAGIRTGVYFFSQATTEAEAVEEASMVLDLVSGYSLSLPIFLDVETSGGRGDAISVGMRTKCIQAFCRTITNAGYSAGVYANTNWLTEKINTSQLTSYHIWMAQYAASPTYQSTRYDIWQYTKTGRVYGISGDVDMSRVYRSY